MSSDKPMPPLHNQAVLVPHLTKNRYIYPTNLIISISGNSFNPLDLSNINPEIF
ncbi:hypothetical protein [Nostoc sp. ChiVER01]|uniref:hypothetical protein n=1 Tax=Nostoc sp. ChiVER01 TaxID=3075382 RepID=UPI002AD1F1B2|nr:hypothetical protein [Nostoc sp. ChiVER01]MDZ8227279.1 hypothetical protein [Nostoc sp. ChiVER01]